MTELPTPITDVLDATNEANLPRFLDAFASDSFVDDAGRTFRGHEAISSWSKAESIGLKQTITVTDTHQDGTTWVVTGTVGGGGYTGPATFTFTLSPDRETVHSMVITG